MSQLVQPGDVLAGKYRVEKVLGEGGMGVVVAARHLQLDVLVAVKFMTDEAQGDVDLVARFLREGRAAARLRSEHVARVTDVGTLESGAPYQVMEYLDGRDLSQVLLGSGPLPIPLATEFIVQACEALQEAHSAGIVHRDIKPSNLFLTMRPNGTPCVKLLDFGISKTDLRGAAAHLQPGTHAQTVLGTPFYMAPEQMRALRDADSRADIWALGATLYELLTGRVPFRANTLIDLAFKVAQSNPRPLRLVRSDVPPALEEAVLRCLEKDRDARFSTARDLALALTPFATRSAAPGSVPDVAALEGPADAKPGPAFAGSVPPTDTSDPPPMEASPRPWWKTGAKVSWGASSKSSRKRSAAWLVAGGVLLVLGAGVTFGVLRSPGAAADAPAVHAEATPDRRAMAVAPAVASAAIADKPAPSPSPSPSASTSIPTLAFSELPEAPSPPAWMGQPQRPMGLPGAPVPAPGGVAAVPGSPPAAPGVPGAAPQGPPPAAPGAGAPASCEQPTYLDEHGRTKFKPECLDSPLFKVAHPLPGTIAAAPASPSAAPPSAPPAPAPAAPPPPKPPAAAYDPFSTQR